ncbi:MAG TPA: DnaJ family domain-containing protein [Pyrinomonadaceae bacterium]|nr:DnaJ family domain-containing protein [Pyrinomonadaceae bacterium]
MTRLEKLVEKKIREAMEKGEFDNLPGKGEPIDLSENPFEDPEMRTVHRLLRNAGFAPAFIEERKSIETELARWRQILSRAQKLYGNESRVGEWNRVKNEFRVAVREVNDRIRLYNLKTPAPVFQRSQVDADAEIAQVESAAG